MHNNTSYIRSNTREDLELEKYYGRIKATCARKTIVTLFDLIYLLAVNLPIFVLCAWWQPDSSKVDLNIIDAFHKLVEKSTNIPAWRMLVFSIWIFFVLYIYFVLIPAKTSYQTFFSSYLGMKAIAIEESINWQGKLKQSQLFRANFIPVFAIPLMCIIFFYGAWVTNDHDWYERLIQGGFRNMKRGYVDIEPKSYWIYGMKMLIVVIFFLQIHHLFTVSASKRALNWFTKSNRIIYVNVERALVLLDTETKKVPTYQELMAPEISSEKIDVEEEEEEELDEEEMPEYLEKETPLTKAAKIDFSADIDLSIDEFLMKLKGKDRKPAEEEETTETKGKGFKKLKLNFKRKKKEEK